MEQISIRSKNICTKQIFKLLSWFKFVLSFEDKNGGASHSDYNLSKVEIKHYNVKIDGRNFFDQPNK